MITIGLDLAVRTCGIAISDSGRLIKYSSYISKEKEYLKLQTEIVNWIFFEISSYINEPHTVNLEDLFYGANFDSTKWACRTQGAVIDRLFELTKQYPYLLMATTARKAIGIDSWADKAEIQLFVIDKFNLKQPSEETRGEILGTQRHWDLEYHKLMNLRKSASKPIKIKIDKDIRDLNRITKNTFGRLSTKIKNETGLNEHMADAIILSAYQKI